MIENPNFTRGEFKVILRRAHELLAFALNNPEASKVQVIPFDMGEGRGGLVLPQDCRRAKVQEMKPAVLALAVTDEVIKQVRGNPKLCDEFFLVRVPKETGQRFDSPIALVGERQ